MKPFSPDLSVGFTTNDRWTARDRVNVEIWAKIADGESHKRPVAQRIWFSLSEDTVLLVSAGFTRGFTGFCWFGTDNQGYTWRVFCRPENGKTLWSRNEEQSPVKPDKWSPEPSMMKLSDFRARFTTQYNNYGSKRQ